MPIYTRLVASGYGDAHELDNNTSFSNVATNMYSRANSAAGSRWNWGVRFFNVNIPAGAVINYAHLRVWRIDNNVETRIKGVIYGDATYSGTTYATDNFNVTNDVTNRSTWGSIGGVSWDAELGKNVAEYSPDISSLIQHLVDDGESRSGGYVQNESFSLLFFSDTTPNLNQMSFHTYDNNSTNCTQLYVDYTAPSTGSYVNYYYDDNAEATPHPRWQQKALQYRAAGVWEDVPIKYRSAGSWVTK